MKGNEYLKHWFSTKDNFAPQGTLGNVWRDFRSSQLGGSVLVVFDGQRLRMPLDIL